MTEPAILKADFVHWYPVQGRKVLKLIFEVPVENTMDVLNKLGAPVVGNWCAIAKLTSGAKDGPVAATSQPDDGDAASPAAAPAKLKFSRTREAGMLCKDAAFQQWLQTYWPVNWMNAVGHARDPAKPDSIAAAFVHHWCGVTSRTELDNVNFIIHGRWDELATRFMQETGRMAVDR